MKTSRRRSATVHAGSMADIAFLLLIFFLVTTTISADKGILRTLPKDCPPNSNCNMPYNERNVLRIAVNDTQDIRIGEEQVKLKDVKDYVSQFIDNNGKSTCDYCNGVQKPDGSDHPQKAIISLSCSAQTKYDRFIAVQDEITKAFYNLRAVYAKNRFNKLPEQLNKLELEQVKKAYPFVLSEVPIKTVTE